MTMQEESRPATIAELNRGLGQVNQRIDDLRSDMDSRFRLLMWGIAIGFAAVLAVLGALLAQGA